MLKDLMDFIDSSKTSYNACANIKEILIKNGYKELFEEEEFNIEYGHKYFVTRNSSSIIAFNIPQKIESSLNIIASHLDSPSFKIKPNFNLELKDYHMIETEGYGGMIYSTWFDRPLGIAGRILYKSGESIEEKVIDFNKNLMVIPNLCIHFNRDINNGFKHSATDIKPILGTKKGLLELIYDSFKIKNEDILGFDLYTVNNEKATLAGSSEELLCAPRIDNLLSAYVSLRAFLESNDTFKFYVSFDNEEVGSNTYQGAGANFMQSILKRMALSLNISEDKLYSMLASGMIVSADNAHALHPIYPDKSDINNAPILNKGLVIKHNANQSYTTSGVSEAIFKEICHRAGARYQDFSNRSDIRGGSTLGNILDSSVSMNTIDIGLGQLAMHSAYETCGSEDIIDYYKAMKEFYNSNIVKVKNKYFIK